MIRGWCPKARRALLTKCALKQASMPTMHGGSFSNASLRPNRLIFFRKAIFPSGGGYAAAQERGVSGAVGDFALQTEVERVLVGAGPQEGISTSVYQGRVLLTGRVATPDMKARAVQVAGRVPGVKRVVSYVELRPGAPLAAQPDKPATGLAPRGAASRPLDRLPFASEVVLSEVADMYAAC